MKHERGRTVLRRLRTDTEYQTRTEREAFAVYSQSVFTINEHFALTLGARWARDQLDGEENAFFFSEGGQCLS